MGLVDYEEGISGVSGIAPLDKSDDPSLFTATFGRHNDINAFVDFLTRESFQEQEDFDLRDRLLKSPYKDAFPKSFVGIQSDAEFDAAEARIEKELVRRRVEDEAGVAGVAMGIAAGLLSPTILLPAGQFGRGVSVGKAAASSSGWAVAAVGLQEAILTSAQETRTPGESIAAISGAAVLGGALGGAIKYMSPKAIEATSQKMLNPELDQGEFIPSGPTPTSLSAAAADPSAPWEEGAGGFAPGIIPGLAKISPSTRVMAQKTSSTAHYVQAQFGIPSLELAGNKLGIASAAGGDIQSLAKLSEGTFYKVANKIESIYLSTVNGTKAKIPGIRMIGYKEFNQQVGDAMFAPQRVFETLPAEIQEAANIYRNEIYTPMLRRAQDAGLKGFKDIDEETAFRYMHRQVQQDFATINFEDFRLILKENFRQKLQTRFEEKIAKLSAKEAQFEETERLLQLEGDELAKARQEVLDEAAELQKIRAQIKPQMDSAKAYRRAANSRLVRTDAAKRAALLQLAEQQEQLNEGAIKKYKARTKRNNAKRKVLAYTRKGIKDQQAAALERVLKLEQAEIKTINSVVRKITAIEKKLAKISDKALDKELARLNKQLEAAMKSVERAEKRIAKINNEFLIRMEGGSTESRIRGVRAEALVSPENMARADAQETSALARVKNLTERGEGVKTLDRASLRFDLESAKNIAMQKAADINAKRAVRKNALEKKLDDATKLDTADIVDSVRARRAAAVEKFEDLADRYGIPMNKSRVLDYETAAENMANDLAPRLLGEDAARTKAQLVAERGPEVARMLDIDESAELGPASSKYRKYSDFLNRDIEQVTRSYMRTMGVDLALQERFGTVNPLAPGSVLQKQIALEVAEKRKAISNDPSLSARKKEKALQQVSVDLNEIQRSLQVQLDRLRHLRGRPDNPNSLGFRAGRTLLNLNVTYYMGSVVPSSIGDLARPVLHYGMQDAFSGSFGSLFRGIKELKMSREEAQLAGTALDLANHQRAAALFDQILDVTYRPGLVGGAEKFTQFAANKTGLLALFDYWNVGMKTLASNMFIGKLSRVMQDYAEGTIKEQDIRWLSKSNISPQHFDMIYNKIRESGNFVQGRWWPNTEDWLNDGLSSSQIALNVYRAALVKNVDEAIITPGIERSSWMDYNMGAKIISQFRTFGVSSTMHGTMRVGQDMANGRKMQAIVGINMALAFGALSYYTWAMLRGGKQKETMLNADAATWINEAINRSGMLGIFAEVIRFGDQVPGLEKITSPGMDQPFSQSPFGNGYINSLGPSVSTANSAWKLTQNLNPEGRNDEQLQKGIYKLTPYNNNIWLSGMLQLIAGDE